MTRFHFSPSDYEVDMFFSYTSTIPYDDTLFEVDPNDYLRYPNIVDRFDQFYEGLIKMIEGKIKEQTGRDYFYMLRDNKTVLKIRHKYSGRVYFVGRYDCRRAVGTSCHLFEGYIFDFKKMKKSEYLEDVISYGYGLWKRFEI